MRQGSAVTTPVGNYMLRCLSSINAGKLRIQQVGSLLSWSSLFPRYRFFAGNSRSPLQSTHQTSKTHVDSSPIDCTGIARSVILKNPHFFAKSKGIVKSVSIKDLLFDISDVLPDTTRRFRRVLKLKPEDVLELLLGFQSAACGKIAVGARKVESLWGIFKWASDQDKGFKHLPKSCEAMASLLLRYEMFGDVEFLVLAMERWGILLDGKGIFGNLIEGYVGAGELERAVSVFDRMRGVGLVPLPSCYQLLLDLLVRMKRAHLALLVCLDMVETAVKLTDSEKASFENVIGLLCRDGRVQDARNLVKKFMDLGFEPSSLVLNEMACGYCEKKDFEDLLSFFFETRSIPDVLAGNKIIQTLCSNFGAERADLFRQELEHLGFRPDEITFGILIGWSCLKGNLRSAFVYLSEMLSRGIKPDIHSYNALISGVFREGMWKHAQDILDEMVDRRTIPNLSTFRVLLAGYCRARRFDEAKMMVCKMVDFNLIDPSSLEDTLSSAFFILGLDPLAVRLKRDNDVGFCKTEFFDNLGNGLYLDTNLDEYEKRLAEILDESMVPDFNSLILKECSNQNLRAALVLVDELVWWGQELSLSVFSELVKLLCASCSRIKAITSLLNRMPKLADQLDEGALNLLVQAYCKKGLTHRGKIIFDRMLQRDLTSRNETYSALIMGFWKKGNSWDSKRCWDMVRNNKWLPRLEECKALVECLCHQKMMKEALDLFERMMVSYPHLMLEICHMFLEKFCFTGFTSIAHTLVEELIWRGYSLDLVAYNHLMRGLCEEKRFSIAFMILDSMLDKSLVPCLDVSVALIPQLCRVKKFEKAVLLTEINLREEHPFSFSVHSALIKGLCVIGKVEEASTILQDMLSKGLHPDAEMCNFLFQGLCQVKNVRKIEELLGVMIRKNVSLSISSFRKWVRLMCMEGRVLYALCLKQLMLVQSEPCSLIIYNILVFYLLSSGNNLLVNEVIKELNGLGLPLDEMTYNFLVYGFSRNKDVSSSVEYLSIMISKGLRPCNRGLKAVISCLCDLGELEKVLELSQEMELRGWVHGSLIQNKLVGTLLTHGKLQEADNFLDRMVVKDLIPNAVNYDNLIKQLCSHGRLDKAIDLLNIMLTKGTIPDSTSYDSIINCFCTCNKLDEAMDLHTEMLDRGLKPSVKTWSTLIQRFCQNGKTAEAEGFLISMVRLGDTPTREMYSSVINRYCVENNLRKETELMQAMQQSGYQPNFDMHWSLISNLSNSSDKYVDNSNRGFLSKLLSGGGSAWKNDSKDKLG